MALPSVDGRALLLAGQVIRGDGRGRQIGFPTANVRVDDGSDGLVDRALGVYAASVCIEGDVAYAAVANWGRRPTFKSDGQAILELHIIDFFEDIYGRHLRVELTDFLRPEKAFASAEQLKEQIADDIRRTRQLMTKCREE